MSPFVLEIIRVNSAIAGLVITVGLYSQCIKTFRTKSAKDLSGILIFSLLYNEVSWLIYGFGINEWPIIALTVVALPGEIAILIGYILYGTSR
ncbi:MAG: SemiSWEET family transporter [Gammaproteobacteria bacterium]